jgi:uncharacterized protein (TIGR00725 family)
MMNLNRKNQIITVFGSHNPKPGNEQYRVAEELGNELSAAGYTVATGGYAGTMEAVLKGAGGGIGYTAEIFTAAPNRFVTEERKSATLLQRIDRILTESDGFVCLPGGTGTLLELAAAWEIVNKKMAGKRPIVCLGEFWKPVVMTLAGEPTIDNIHSLQNQKSTATSYVLFASKPSEVVSLLE